MIRRETLDAGRRALRTDLGELLDEAALAGDLRDRVESALVAALDTLLAAVDTFEVPRQHEIPVAAFALTRAWPILTHALGPALVADEDVAGRLRGLIEARMVTALSDSEINALIGEQGTSL